MRAGRSDMPMLLQTRMGKAHSCHRASGILTTPRGPLPCAKPPKPCGSAGLTGCPIRFVRTGQAVWIEDLDTDSSLRRSEFAKLAGLRSRRDRHGFPIVLHDQVVGVLEFFSKKPQEANVETIKTLGHVGALLGSVAQRNQAEEEVARSQKEAETAHARLMDAIEGNGAGYLPVRQGRQYRVVQQTLCRSLQVVSPVVWAPKVGNPFEVGLRLSAKPDACGPVCSRTRGMGSEGSEGARQ